MDIERFETGPLGLSLVAVTSGKSVRFRDIGDR